MIITKVKIYKAQILPIARKMRIKQLTSRAQKQRTRIPPPFVGLSPLEMVALLEKAANSPEIPEGSSSGSLQHTDSQNITSLTRRYAAKVKGTIAQERILEIPQVIVEQSESEFRAIYNPGAALVVTEAVNRLQKHAGTNPALDYLIQEISEKRRSMERRQVIIARYLYREQRRYIESYIPLDLKPVRQKDIARIFNYSKPYISRLMNNLTIGLPNGKVIFAGELAPGPYFFKKKVPYILRQLSQDQLLFGEGKWKVSDKELLPLVNRLIGPNLQIGRRGLANYTRAFEQNYVAQNPTA